MSQPVLGDLHFCAAALAQRPQRPPAGRPHESIACWGTLPGVLVKTRKQRGALFHDAQQSCGPTPGLRWARLESPWGWKARLTQPHGLSWLASERRRPGSLASFLSVVGSFKNGFCSAALQNGPSGVPERQAGTMEPRQPWEASTPL